MFVRLERKLVRLFLLCILLLLVSVPATATDEGPFEPLDTITMNDGSVLKGRIVDEDQDKVVLETPFGRLDVPRDEIDLIERTDSHGRTQFEGQHDPDTNSIFLTPTPETKGHGAYFRNYMLFFVNWGLAVHENVDVTVGTFLPITGDFEWLSAGIKWRLFSREEHRVGVAVIANGNWIGGTQSGSIGAVVGVGDDDRSFNVAVGNFVYEDNDPATAILVGTDARVGRRTKVLFEYATTSDAIDEDFKGLINVGIRWYGTSMSFSLTGFRPLADSGDIAFLPLAMFSLHF